MTGRKLHIPPKTLPPGVCRGEHEPLFPGRACQAGTEADGSAVGGWKGGVDVRWGKGRKA